MTKDSSVNVDEDTELRELLISNLESRGMLSQIKADLRAAIYKCLEDDTNSTMLPKKEVQIPLSLCSDLLDKLGLFNTAQVLQSESGTITKSKLLTRSQLISKLKLFIDNEKPLLNHILKKEKQNDAEVSVDKFKERARNEFNHYTHGRSDSISLEDAPYALLDVFPFLSGKQAESVFVDIKSKSEVKFHEWFSAVEKFRSMCYQIHSSVQKMTSDGHSSAMNKSGKTDLKPKYPSTGDGFSRTETSEMAKKKYTKEFSESQTSEHEITEGALPDSDSDISTENLNFSRRTNPELTEDFSLRSEQPSKFVDYIENV